MSRAAPDLDTRALTEPVDSAAVRAYRRAHARASNDQKPPGSLWRTLLLIPAAVFTIGYLMRPAFGVGYLIAGLAALAGVLAITGCNVLRRWRLGETNYRLDRFARANGFEFVPRVSHPALPGIMFEQHGGSRPAVSQVVHGLEPWPFEVGNFSAQQIRDEQAGTSHGYMLTTLNTRLPHVVLDSRKNRVFGRAAISTRLQQSQRLRLEGNFDAHFSLYAPEGYEADALYLFTPDVMALVIDYGARFDIELVENFVVFSHPRPLSTTDPDRWRELLILMTAVRAKIGQWERWRDERAQHPMTPEQGPTEWRLQRVDEPGDVAPAGRRLRGRITPGQYLFMIAIIAAAVWGLFAS